MNTAFLKSKGPSAISRTLGVSRPTATKYVRGEACITVDQAIKLAQHYNVPLSNVIDPGYEDKNEALEAENRQLRNTLATIVSKVKETGMTVEFLAMNACKETGRNL